MASRLPTLRLPRLGLASRLIVTVLLLLFAAITLTGGVTVIARSTDPASRFPLADQIAALHALVERSPAADRATLLRAVNSADFDIRIVKTRPERAATDARLPGVEWLIAQYLETVGANEVFATFSSARSSRFARALARLSPVSNDELTIAISLASREYLLVSLRGSPAARVWGMPVGFWLGGIGALIAAVVIIAIIREARPIEVLAGSVEAFARDATPRPVTPAGAPEIRALIEASNTMQSRIAALLKGRTVMLGAVSHDLKTFLTRLRLRVETIEDETMRQKAVRDIEDMVHIVDTALALARGAGANGRRETVDLAALIAADIDSRSTDPGPEIRLHGASQVLQISGDRVGLQRIVANLVDNAVRHGKRQVEVRVTRSGPGYRMTVDDDGPGIPEAERRAVFEPFYRLETSRNRTTGGSGLGLAIVRDLVEAHGGGITIEASHLGGARAVVLLPIGATG